MLYTQDVMLIQYGAEKNPHYNFFVLYIIQTYSQVFSISPLLWDKAKNKTLCCTVWLFYNLSA